MAISSHSARTVEARSAEILMSDVLGGGSRIRRASAVRRNSSTKSKRCIFQESKPSRSIFKALATVE